MLHLNIENLSGSAISQPLLYKNSLITILVLNTCIYTLNNAYEADVGYFVVFLKHTDALNSPFCPHGRISFNSSNDYVN